MHHRIWFIFVMYLIGSFNVAHAQAVLRVADQKGLQKALLEAAHALDGVPYRIEWSEFEAASPLLQALGAGAVDTGVAGDGPFLFAYGAGLKLHATMAIPPRAGGRIIAVITARNSPIHTAADLKGKRIATVRGSVGHYLLLKLAERGVFRLDEITLVLLSPAQSKAALESGSVDAWATWEPYISLEEAQAGGRVVADGGGVTSNYAFQIATDAAIRDKRDQLADFYHRVARAYAWGDTHPDAYASIWSKQTGLPLAVSTKIAREMRTSAVPLTDAIVATEKATLETYYKAGVLPPGGPGIDGAFDRSFTRLN
jgi:sulfonate transport system substrate-binding protein